MAEEFLRNWKCTFVFTIFRILSLSNGTLRKYATGTRISKLYPLFYHIDLLSPWLALLPKPISNTRACKKEKMNVAGIELEYESCQKRPLTIAS